MQYMKDKEMVNDILAMYNSSLTCYANYIAQTSNQQLRQTLQQIRNADEQFQYQLYQLAEKKGFYKPAGEASPQEIQQVKNQFNFMNA
ncbi:Coat F domain-containing protein [Thermosyntropha lipolytica DSM 11003]|uniref:Coat F domain-containing protein n=2 Tax=Thermosyntropha TaxID=54293 RepID=A0A1M5JH25_9FIRM|nr:Coat F domain-containing protein [Thermosyntropha lipolytica DSM 11003]